MKILSALVLALVLAVPPAWAWRGLVLEAASGRELLVRDPDGRDVLVRLYGLETPPQTDPAGQAARRGLDALAREREVDVLPVAGEGSRVEGHVLLDLQDLSREMVRQGLAWVDWRRCAQGVCERWLEQEQAARSQGLGLWRDHPLRPTAPVLPGG